MSKPYRPKMTPKRMRGVAALVNELQDYKFEHLSPAERKDIRAAILFLRLLLRWWWWTHTKRERGTAAERFLQSIRG